MRKFLLYGHGGSYNHGAEAIVKTTIGLVREKYGKSACVALSSHFPEQDREFGVGADILFAPVREIWEREKQASGLRDKERLAREMYAEALDFIESDTVCLSVGGDNFCYPGWHRLAVFQQKAAQKGAKSILWGASIEPSFITPAMVDVLNTYTHIIVRESLSQKALRQHNVTADVRLIPDPAFSLTPQAVNLPQGFEKGQMAGINISPLVTRREQAQGILQKNILNLVEYILTKTPLNIALIPHVAMPMDNDFNALSEILRQIPSSYHSRTWPVENIYSAAQLKHIISNCAMMVCARTHASIAAYAYNIPTLVIGYSVKARGIAEDLGTAEWVTDITKIDSPDTIKNIFAEMRARQHEIEQTLKHNYNQYPERVKEYKGYI